VTWRSILVNWELIEADMQEHYHLDLSTPGLLEERSARWMRVRIDGLFGVESRLQRKLFPPKK